VTPIGAVLTVSQASSGGSGIEPVLLVGVGGAAGALTRFAIGELISIDRYPASVIAVNLLGSVLATLLFVRSPGDELVLLTGVGFCGSLTTFSTFSVQTVRLWTEDRPAAAISVAFGTLLACLVGASLVVAIHSTL